MLQKSCSHRTAHNFGQLQARFGRPAPHSRSLSCTWGVSTAAVLHVCSRRVLAQGLVHLNKRASREQHVLASALPEYTLTEKPPARLAVFVSGGGSNMKALHAAIQAGRLNAEIAVSVETGLSLRPTH